MSAEMLPARREAVSDALVRVDALRALAHAAQGWRSARWVFRFGLVMQGLVALTGTLALAMVVHLLYDLIASTLIAAEARSFSPCPETA